jgi:hypothetical protein
MFALLLISTLGDAKRKSVVLGNEYQWFGLVVTALYNEQ